jgi:hypothetical protein
MVSLTVARRKAFLRLNNLAVRVDRSVLIILALLTVYIVWGTTYLAIRFALEASRPT